MKIGWIGCSIAAFALMWPVLAFANIGIPMLALAWPVHWIAFIPIVIIESELAAKELGLPRRIAYKAVAAANTVSTIVGIPAAWAVMFVSTIAVGMSLSLVLPNAELQKGMYYALFPLMSAWLGPTENTWLIYLAFVCLALPMWYGSVIIESWVMSRLLRNIEPKNIRRTALRFNTITYALILTAVGVYAAWLAAQTP